MTLLHQIQDAAVDDKVSLNVVLRKATVLAARLDNDELRDWLRREQNGYFGDYDNLPGYRIAGGSSRGTFLGAFGRQLSNVPLPPMCLPEALQEQVRECPLVESVSSYEEILSREISGSLRIRWPADLTVLVARDFYPGMALTSAWFDVSPGVVRSVLDAVRSRLLDFCLEIERLDPEAGEASVGNPTVPEAAVTQIYYSVIMGNAEQIGTDMSQHNQNVERSVVGQIAGGDISGKMHLKIQAAINASKNDEGAAAALGKLAEAVQEHLADQEATQREALSYIAGLAEQVASPPTERNPVVAKAIWEKLKDLLKGYPALSPLLTSLGTLLAVLISG